MAEEVSLNACFGLSNVDLNEDSADRLGHCAAEIPNPLAFSISVTIKEPAKPQLKNPPRCDSQTAGIATAKRNPALRVATPQPRPATVATSDQRIGLPSLLMTKEPLWKLPTTLNTSVPLSIGNSWGSHYATLKRTQKPRPPCGTRCQPAQGKLPDQEKQKQNARRQAEECLCVGNKENVLENSKECARLPKRVDEYLQMGRRANSCRPLLNVFALKQQLLAAWGSTLG